MSEAEPKAIWILFITGVGLVFKMVIGEFLADSFEYDKHGYDLCGVAFGASLSSFALQITSKADLFPGLPKTGWWSLFSTISPDIVIQRSLMLLGLLLLNCVGLLLTAWVCNIVKKGGVHWKGGLMLVNYLIGGAFLGTSIWVLLTKQ